MPKGGFEILWQNAENQFAFRMWGKKSDWKIPEEKSQGHKDNRYQTRVQILQSWSGKIAHINLTIRAHSHLGSWIQMNRWCELTMPGSGLVASVLHPCSCQRWDLWENSTIHCCETIKKRSSSYVVGDRRIGQDRSIVKFVTSLSPVIIFSTSLIH